MATPVVDVWVAFGKGFNESAAYPADFTKISTANNVRQFRVKRGRGHQLDTIQAGTASLVLDNANGYLDPSNTGSGSPYYTGGATNVKPGRHVVIEATDPETSTTYKIFRGFAESWEQKYGRDGVDQLVVLKAVDAFKVLARALGDGGVEAETTSRARVKNLWSQAGYPQAVVGWTDGKTVPARTYEESDNLLLAAQAIDKAEVGFFFVDRSGLFSFLTRESRVTQFGTKEGTFSDDLTADPTAFPYHAVDFSRDDDEVFNRGTATLYNSATTATTQNDTTSQTDYGIRTYDEPELMLTSGSEATSWAAYAVDRFANPEDRARVLTFYPQDHPALWAKILPMDLGELWVVKRRPKAGNTITVNVLTEQIIHEGRPGIWRTELALSSAVGGSYWVLDDGAGTYAASSTLGSTTKLFY